MIINLGAHFLLFLLRSQHTCGKSKFLPMNYTFRLFLGLTESPTTYNVKCLHESGPNSIIYRASFFTSEVDKVNTGKIV